MYHGAIARVILDIRIPMALIGIQDVETVIACTGKNHIEKDPHINIAVKKF